MCQRLENSVYEKHKQPMNGKTWFKQLSLDEYTNYEKYLKVDWSTIVTIKYY